MTTVSKAVQCSFDDHWLSLSMLHLIAHQARHFLYIQVCPVANRLELLHSEICSMLIVYSVDCMDEFLLDSQLEGYDCSSASHEAT